MAAVSFVLWEMTMEHSCYLEMYSSHQVTNVPKWTYLCVASHNQEMIDVLWWSGEEGIALKNHTPHLSYLHKTIEHDEVGWERAAILIVWGQPREGSGIEDLGYVLGVWVNSDGGWGRRWAWQGNGWGRWKHYGQWLIIIKSLTHESSKKLTEGCIPKTALWCSDVCD